MNKWAVFPERRINKLSLRSIQTMAALQSTAMFSKISGDEHYLELDKTMMKNQLHRLLLSLTGILSAHSLLFI